jgi:hypothetical protein
MVGVFGQIRSVGGGHQIEGGRYKQNIKVDEKIPLGRRKKKTPFGEVVSFRRKIHAAREN